VQQVDEREKLQQLLIPADVMAEMIAHARAEDPKECCGILSGGDGCVDEFFSMTNADASELTYRLDPAEQFEVMRTIRKKNKDLVAIFHSHPASPAWPSPTDIRQAFFADSDEPNYPGVAYVILSLAGPDPDTRAFIIEKDSVSEIRIVLNH